MASTEHVPSFAYLEYDTPLYRTAIAQFDQAVPHASVDPGIAERLRHPERSIIVSCPIKLDDGSRVVFPGYRVQHSSVLGPTKGGIRYDPEVSLGECAALAVWMTWKCALLRLPYGGAKGGVRCNPREMSHVELERLTRRFTSELLPFIGPQEDIPAPDMATNEQTMAWMMDTYSMQRGHAVPEIVTGKPIAIGGSVFRHEATGAGVVMVIARACERLEWRLSEQRCVVQGFGNVGGIAAQELVDRGATVIGVSDVSGGVHDPAGLDIPTMSAYAREHGSLEGWETGTRVSNEELLELECDILVLAAREDQIHGDNASRLRCRMIAEGANGPTSLEGDAVLARARHPDPPRRAHERRRRDGLVFRVGPGSRASLLGPRRDPREARREAQRCLRPRLGDLARTGHPDAHGGARRRDPRRVDGARGPRAVPVSTRRPPPRVRDAMIADPRSLPATASARDAGEVLTPAEVRAVYVVGPAGELVGVVTRKTLVARVVAEGRDPSATQVGDLAEAPYYTIDADTPLDDAFRFIEEQDAERVPVVDDGRLVGVISRAVLQRRLAEDEEPARPTPTQAPKIRSLLPSGAADVPGAPVPVGYLARTPIVYRAKRGATRTALR